MAETDPQTLWGPTSVAQTLPQHTQDMLQATSGNIIGRTDNMHGLTDDLKASIVARVTQASARTGKQGTCHAEGLAAADWP